MSVALASLAADAPLLVDGIQGTLENQTDQYLATVALGLSFLVAVWIIYLGGGPLKRRFSEEVVDIARTLTIMVVALAAAGVFVVIWRAEDPVWAALTEFSGRFLINDTLTAVKLFVAFIALLGTYTLTRVTKRIIRHWSEQGRISPHQREISHHGIQLVLFFFTVAFMFVLFNQNPRDLFLGAGVLGVVLGFAARKTLSGVLSGFVILFGRPFEAGDWIAVGDRQGIVTDITAFNTQIRTFNEEHVLVPNDRVTDKEVINYSKTERLRLVTEVGIDYDTDIEKAATIAKKTMKACETVAATPSPDVILESFGDSAVVLQLRYWIDEPTIQRKLSAQNEVIDEVKAAFESDGVKIPYPQRELMGRAETDGLRLASETDVSVGDEVEQAVRRVRTDSTAVQEPVEAEYRDDGEDDVVDTADGKEGNEAPDPEDDEPERADDDEPGVTEEAGDGNRNGDGTGDESDDEEEATVAREDPSDLVNEQHDVSPRTRERFEDVGPKGKIEGPVEEEYRDDGEADAGEDESDEGRDGR